MSDRDRHRHRDPLHPDQTWDDEDRTPVGHPPGSRRRSKTPVMSIEQSGEIEIDDLPVSAAPFDPDIRWAEFREMRDEVKRCAEDRARESAIAARKAKWRKWILGGEVLSAGSVIGLLIWGVTKLDARARAQVEEEQRIRAIERLQTEIRVLQDWRIKADTLLGLRAWLPDPRTP